MVGKSIHTNGNSNNNHFDFKYLSNVKIEINKKGKTKINWTQQTERIQSKRVATDVAVITICWLFSFFSFVSMFGFIRFFIFFLCPLFLCCVACVARACVCVNY